MESENKAFLCGDSCTKFLAKYTRLTNVDIEAGLQNVPHYSCHFVQLRSAMVTSNESIASFSVRALGGLSLECRVDLNYMVERTLRMQTYAFVL